MGPPPGLVGLWAWPIERICTGDIGEMGATVNPVRGGVMLSLLALSMDEVCVEESELWTGSGVEAMLWQCVHSAPPAAVE